MIFQPRIRPGEYARGPTLPVAYLNSSITSLALKNCSISVEINRDMTCFPLRSMMDNRRRRQAERSESFSPSQHDQQPILNNGRDNLNSKPEVFHTTNGITPPQQRPDEAAQRQMVEAALDAYYNDQAAFYKMATSLLSRDNLIPGFQATA